jgi:hypothetical protein
VSILYPHCDSVLIASMTGITCTISHYFAHIHCIPGLTPKPYACLAASYRRMQPNPMRLTVTNDTITSHRLQAFSDTDNLSRLVLLTYPQLQHQIGPLLMAGPCMWPLVLGQRPAAVTNSTSLATLSSTYREPPIVSGNFVLQLLQQI